VIAEFDALSAQIIPFRQHPVVEHPRQQIPVVLGDCGRTMLKHPVIVAGPPAPAVLTDTHDGTRTRPRDTSATLSPHQCGRLNNESGVVTEQHAQMMQLSTQVRPRCLSVESSQNMPARRCRGWGTSACTARSRATRWSVTSARGSSRSALRPTALREVRLPAM
jgi:hypothetical protein